MWRVVQGTRNVVALMPARLVPPDDSANDLSVEDEAAWIALVSAQLADTRRSAENWRNGLVGLLGLVTIFSVVRGSSSDLGGLDRWTAAIIGIFLLASLLAAAIGTLASLRAAYWHPNVLSRAAFRELGGVEGFRFEEARTAMVSLGRARATTLFSLGFLVIAVGLAWYSPRSTANLVEVSTRSGTHLCGTLADSSEGKIQVNSPDTGAVLVNLGNVTSVHVVRSC
jgi:hypothetical protein